MFVRSEIYKITIKQKLALIYFLIEKIYNQIIPSLTISNYQSHMRKESDIITKATALDGADPKESRHQPTGHIHDVDLNSNVHPIQNSQDQIKRPVQIGDQRSESKDHLDMNEIKQFFIRSQYRKLKILYPTIEENQMEAIAQQIWETYSPQEKKIYQLKWKQSQNEEEKLFSYPQVNLTDQQIDSATDKSGNEDAAQALTDEISPIDYSNRQRNITNQNEITETAENDDIASTAAHSQGDGQSNAETNTSTLANEQSNRTALPLIYALVECSKSNSDESQLNDTIKVTISSHCSSTAQQNKEKTIEQDNILGQQEKK